MAARWRNTLRRTGETTVRIFTATRPASRNWVRNPILAHLHPWILPVLGAVWHTHISVPVFTSQTECAHSAEHILGEKRDRNSSINQKQDVVMKYFRIRTGEKKGCLGRNSRGDTFPVSPFGLSFTFPHGIWEIFSLSVVTWVLTFKHPLLNCEQGFNLLLAAPTTVKSVALFHLP